MSDSGETTDTSGSGSISDWALVSEDGHLQDDDTESSGSSVEVMEDGEEEEEDVTADPITPVAGNSPSGTQPLFVLRLSNHEVSDTDEEPSQGRKEISPVAQSAEVTTDEETSQGSKELSPGAQSAEVTTDEETSQGRKESSPVAQSAEVMTDGSSTVASSVDTLGSLFKTSLATSTTTTEDSTVEDKPDLIRAVSQEEIDSLRQTIDDVQRCLLQSRAAATTSQGLQSPADHGQGEALETQTPDNSLSSFELFGGDGEIQDTESHACAANKETVPPAVAADSATMGGNSKGHQQHATVNSPEDRAGPRPEGSGTVAVVEGQDDEGVVETVGPGNTDDTQIVVREPNQGWARKMFLWSRRALYWWRQVTQERALMPWFLGSYVLLLSVMVCVVVAFFTITPGFEVPRSKTPIKESEIPRTWTDLAVCQDKLTAAQGELDIRWDAQLGLEGQLRASLKARAEERAWHEAEFEALQKKFNQLQLEMAMCEARVSELVNVERDGLREEPAKDDSESESQSESVPADQVGKKSVDQSKENKHKQSAKRGENQSEPKSTDPDKNMHRTCDRQTKEERQKKKEKNRQEEKRRGNSDTGKSGETEPPESDEGYTESDNSSGNWMDNIFDIMNKTKDQIQETWVQVRNISDKLWKEHSPTLEKLQTKFAKKFQHLSSKLQRKIEKRTRKWFGGGRKTSDKDGPTKEEEEETAESHAETKRRPFKDEEDFYEGKGGCFSEFKVPTKCDPRLMELSRKVKLLNKRKYLKMTNEARGKLHCRSKHVLRQLLGEETVLSDKVQRRWVKCQSDWWNQEGEERSEVVGRCLRYLGCWQVKLSNGKGRCQKKGNDLDGRCPVGPISEEHAWRDQDHLNPDTICDNEQPRDSKSHKQTLHDRQHDNTDEGDDDNDDGEDDLWYMARAQEREYQRDIPDYWYFRRLRNHDSPDVYPKTYTEYENDVEDYWSRTTDL